MARTMQEEGPGQSQDKARHREHGMHRTTMVKDMNGTGNRMPTEDMKKGRARQEMKGTVQTLAMHNAMPGKGTMTWRVQREGGAQGHDSDN